METEISAALWAVVACEGLYVFLVLAKILAGKSISEMTYFMSIGM